VVAVSEIDYGKLNKRIVFTENDHRHAQLIVRLKYDDLRQSDFFRSLITGYIEGDKRITDFVDEIKQQSKKKKKTSKKLKADGEERSKSLGFSDEQIEDIFDLIAEEHPEL
jgi:DNA-binding transcriptional regulator YhcF (GntR family)